MKKNLLFTGAFLFAATLLSAQSGLQNNPQQAAPVMKSEHVTEKPLQQQSSASAGKLSMSSSQNKQVNMHPANQLAPQKLSQNIKDKPNPQPGQAAGSVPAPAK